jgi:general secretion pathway protein G
VNLTGMSTIIGKRRKHSRDACVPRAVQWAGFTLLELMIVITIILILAGMAAGRYEKSVLRAKEATLKQDLFVMRQAIQQYTLDKQAAPASLDDLVQAKYISAIPTDPITRNKDWHLDFEQVLLSPEQTSSGLTDVHSSSTAVSPFENTPYDTW